MRFSNDGNCDDNTAVNRTNHDKSNFQVGLDYWQSRFSTAIPTIFPLRSSSEPSHRSVVDASITGRFFIPSNGVVLGHGIELSTILTLAYSLVLNVHADSFDEVVFVLVHYPERIDGSGTVSMTSLVQRITFDWNQTTLFSLINLQKDTSQLASQQPFGPIPTEVASLFRTILCFHPISTVENERFVIPGDVDYDLALNIKPISSEEIEVKIQYASRAISEPEVRAFLDHFGAAVENISHNLTSPLSEISLITSKEQQRLIREIHPIRTTLLSQAENTTQLVEEQVRKTPQKIALQFDQDHFVTYNQLDLLANDVGRTLVSYGARSGDLVGIYMDKSCEMFIAILGIYKAAGGYVPLDPDHPPERIQTILTIANIKIVLTHKRVRSHLDAEKSVRVLEIDMHDLSPATKPDVCVTRDNIAHVFFTSGSTGVPKGVVLTHGSIIESCVGSQEVIGNLGRQRVLQFSNYTFDLCVWDWGCTLISGGTLCIVSKYKLLDDIGSVARSLDITYLGATPTVARLFTPEQVPSLQMLALGGELLTPEVRDKWADEVTLINMYGPTEASTCVTAQTRVTTSTASSDIGKTFGSNAVYILDEHLRPVPLGCVGELYIGGPQVARGYLRNPEQTAKAFVEDPFHPGSIMYASGDLVRISPVDHSIHYLGRRDTQIKIRGQRIEVGEIESVLKKAGSVITNAAVVKVDVENERLVAFLEYPSSSAADDISIVHKDVGVLLGSMRHVAQQRLPTFMIPTIYVPLNRFPLGSSGKLDRRSLTAFFHAHHEEIKALRVDPIPELLSSEVPQNEVQVTLRSLWASILNCEEDSLGIDDNFILVGGNSISATRLASAARIAGLCLHVTDIIQNPTIRQMSQVVRSAIPDHDYDDDETSSLTLDKMLPRNLPLLRPTPVELDSLRHHLFLQHGLSASDVLDVYPSTPIQTTILSAETTIPGVYISSIPLDLSPQTDILKLKKAFDDFINHPNGMMLRTVFIFNSVKNEWLQTLIRPGRKHMEWTIVKVEDETELDRYISEYQRNGGSEPFGDGKLPSRGCIFELNGYARALVWTLHHAVMDGWSLERMMSDIQCVYSNKPLRPRRSFKSMIKYLQRHDHSNGIEFWRRHLENASPTLICQRRRPAGAISDTIASRDVEIANCTSLTRRFGIMVSTLVTCAWSIVLSVHIGATDVVFGQVLANRSLPIKDIESMTGVMINVVARRVTFDPNATVIETLRQIQRDQLEINRHEHISLFELQSEGIPVYLFNNLLNFINQDLIKGVGDDKLAEDPLFVGRREGSFGGDQCAFSLNVVLRSDILSITFVGTSELISESAVHMLLNNFQYALRFIMDDPERSISGLLTHLVLK